MEAIVNTWKKKVFAKKRFNAKTTQKEMKRKKNITRRVV